MKHGGENVDSQSVDQGTIAGKRSQLLIERYSKENVERIEPLSSFLLDDSKDTGI